MDKYDKIMASISKTGPQYYYDDDDDSSIWIDDYVIEDSITYEEAKKAIEKRRDQNG